MENMNLFGGSSPAPVSKYKNKIIMYHGTSSSDFRDPDRTPPIEEDPERESNCYYEFGHGFYIGPDLSLAEEYASFSDSKSTISKDLKKGKSKEDLIAGLDSVPRKAGYILEYEVDMLNMYSDGLLQEYEPSEVIAAYRISLGEYLKNRQYRPTVDFSYGPLCGKVWDDIFRNVDSSKTTASDYQKLMEQIIKDLKLSDIDGRMQLCIHRKETKNHKSYTDYVRFIKRYPVK